MLTLSLAMRPIGHWIGSKERSSAIGWIALSVTILAAGTYSGFAKVLSSSLTPVTFVFVSELLTGLFVLLSFGAMPILRKLLSLDRKAYLPLLVVALTSGTAAPLLMFSGLGSSTAVNASLLGNTEMVFLILLAIAFLGERFTKMHFVSSCLIVLGVITIAMRGFTEGFSFYRGDILFLLASAVWSVGSITFRKYLHSDPHVVLFVRSCTAVTFFLLFSSIFGPSLMEDIRIFPLALLPALLGFAFISRFLNVFAFYEALDRLPVTTVSLLGNCSLVVSVLFAHFYAGEAITWYHLLGGAFILFGTILLELVGVHPSQKHHEGHLRQRQLHRS